MTHIRGIERDVPSVDHGRMNPIGRILIGAIVSSSLCPAQRLGRRLPPVQAQRAHCRLVDEQLTRDQLESVG